MANRNMLVTGGAGFIGSNFVRFWKAKYPDDLVVVLDALTYAGNISNLESVMNNNEFVFVHGNICDFELVQKLLNDYKLDTIVHFAAESHVDKSIVDPDEFMTTNIIGTYTLLKAAKKIWIDSFVTAGKPPRKHRFHHISTDEVYGSLKANQPPFEEHTAYEPNSPYSASKAASDHLVRAFHKTYGLEVTISNCSNNYGPYHYPEKLIPLTITNVLHNEPIPIYGDGKQIRDWLYVEDHSRGIELVLNSGTIGEKYNIGGNNEWANIDIALLVCRLLNEAFTYDLELSNRYPNAINAIQGKSEELITFVTDRLGHDRRYAIDATKSNRELGYQPIESFESGIKKTVQWFLTNQNWWKPLR